MPKRTTAREHRICADCGESFEMYRGAGYARCDACRLQRHMEKHRESAQEAWIREHTFQCPMGRITDEHCKMLRSRPTVAQLANGGASKGKKPQWGGRMECRPTVCETCKRWEERRDMVKAEKDKIETITPATVPCRECGQPVEPWQQGAATMKTLCRKCYRAKIKAGNSGKSSQVRLMIDFTAHKELLEILKAAAENDYRTPELQVLYMISTLQTEGNTG